VTWKAPILVCVVCLVCVMSVVPAAAQAPAPDATAVPAPQVQFLSRFNFHIQAGAVSDPTEMFDWIADLGGDIDFVDYGRGRINFLAQYEVVMGTEYKSFDPNQGNYTLNLSATWRALGGEFLGVFHHISQHLGDRAKTFPIDWNTAGVQFYRPFVAGPVLMKGQAYAAKVVQKSYVDYTWDMGAGLDAQLPVSPRVSVMLRGSMQRMNVDASIADRSAQNGGHGEVALRVAGVRAQMELFCAYERRIDAAPVLRKPENWALAGFRFVKE
jgi:hypothetical protein